MSKEKAPNDKRWNKMNNKMNEIVLGYTPKCKINIHEPMLI